MSNLNDDQILEAIVYFLSHPNGMRIEKYKIKYDTEIYHDLGIYGFDFIDLLVFLGDKFGMHVNIDYTIKCVPGDVCSSELYRSILNAVFGTKIRGKGYESVTVRSLIEAVHQKRWPASPT